MMIKDYQNYEFSIREKMVCFIEGMILNGTIALLFYDSVYALLPGMLLVVFYFREKKCLLAGKRKRQVRTELKEFLNILIAALQTGRSIENGFEEAWKDLDRYTEKETVFLQELKRICAGVQVGEPLEKLLSDFAVRSGVEELEYFAQVFSIGKRSGGNLVGIMKNTIRMIQERMEAEQEIAAAIAQQQLEFRIMTIIPLAIICYLRIGAGSLLECLYGNLLGVTVMTVCLLIYGGCYLYGKRLLAFENR